MVAWLIAASTRAGSSTPFFVRLPAVLLGMGASVLVYRLARDLFASDRVAFLTVLLGSACPLYAAGSVMMTIDAPLIFCWLLCLYALMRASRARGRALEGWWLVTGLAAGLGFLSKYTMLLVVPCVGVAAVLVPSLRRGLRRPAPYAALFVAVACALPVIAWNARHGWVSYLHVASQAGLTALGRSALGTSSEFIGAQLGVVSPALFLVLVVGLVHLRQTKRGGEERWMLLAFSAPVFCFFAVVSAVKKVEANWAAPAYASALVAAAAYWSDLDRRRGSAPKRRRLVLMLFVLAPGWSTIAASHFSASVLALGIHVPARLDPTARLAGWHQLGDAVGESRRRDPTATGFLMSDTYQVASELAFYVPGQPRVHNVNLGRRRNQYDVWGGLEELRGRSGLFVTAAPFARITDEAERAARTKEYWATHPLARSCAALDPVDVVDIRRDGELLRSFSILRCEGFQGLPPTRGDTY